MKKMIAFALVLMMVPIVFGDVNIIGVTGDQIEFESTAANDYYYADRGYWAVNVSLSGCNPTGAICADNYVDCGIYNDEIRVVSYTATLGGEWPASTIVTVEGSGSCDDLGSYQFVEGYYADGTAVPGAVTSGTGSGTLELGGAGECPMKGDISIPCDDKVYNSELLAYMTRWLNEHKTPGCSTDPTCASNANLLEVMGNWLATHKT